MKKSRIIFLILCVCSLVLEAVPYGAVCRFATPEETFIETFSYFSLVPYGYANFGPFITAVLTCLLTVFAVVLFTSAGRKIIGATRIVSIISIVSSLLPLMFGLDYYNFVSLSISLLMIAQFIVIMIISKRKGSKDE